MARLATDDNTNRGQGGHVQCDYFFDSRLYCYEEIHIKCRRRVLYATIVQKSIYSTCCYVIRFFTKIKHFNVIYIFLLN